MRIAQILNGAAHWIFEADEMPAWPPGPDGKAMVLMDITALPDVSEGWLYDEETGGFAEPPAEEEPLAPVASLDAVKVDKKRELRAARDAVLNEGLTVATSMGDKHIRLNQEEREVIKAYKDEITTAMSGLPSSVDLNQGVFFHAEGEPHTWWTVDDFLQVAFVSMQFATIQYARLSTLELMVNAAQTVEEVQAVTFDMEIPGMGGM